MESCADRINIALRLRNMRQIELSAKTGIPKSAISQYCSGAFKPKQKRLFLIAQALDVDEAWLMGLDVPMNRPIGVVIPQTTSQRCELSDTELDIIRKFRRLDDRGKSAVLNILEHEYSSLPGDKANPVSKKA